MTKAFCTWITKHRTGTHSHFSTSSPITETNCPSISIRALRQGVTYRSDLASRTAGVIKSAQSIGLTLLVRLGSTNFESQRIELQRPRQILWTEQRLKHSGLPM